MTPGSERDRTLIVQAALQGTRFAHVRWVAETGSTNADLMAQADIDGQGGERALLTDLQTAGRGRRDRTWHAPSGSALMLSILLREADPAAAFWQVGALALAAAEAASEATGTRVELKWPNDLVIGDKKLAGILGQRSGDAVVIGLGMNVRWQTDMPAEFAARATSLDRHMQGQREVDRVSLACDVLRRTDSWLGAPHDEVRAAWLERCATMQRDVRVELEHGNEVGIAVDVDSSGALVVKQGETCAMFHVGDVVHLRPNNGPMTG